jgi:hypothetical protein
METLVLTTENFRFQSETEYLKKNICAKIKKLLNEFSEPVFARILKRSKQWSHMLRKHYNREGKITKAISGFERKVGPERRNPNVDIENNARL